MRKKWYNAISMAAVLIIMASNSLLYYTESTDKATFLAVWGVTIPLVALLIAIRRVVEGKGTITNE